MNFGITFNLLYPSEIISFLYSARIDQTSWTHLGLTIPLYGPQILNNCEYLPRQGKNWAPISNFSSLCDSIYIEVSDLRFKTIKLWQ